MGHEVRYVFEFEGKHKKDYDKLLKLLEDEGEYADKLLKLLEDEGEYADEYDDEYGGHIDIVMQHSHSFNIGEWLQEHGYKGECKINIYYLERDPDDTIYFNGGE